MARQRRWHTDQDGIGSRQVRNVRGRMEVPFLDCAKLGGGRQMLDIALSRPKCRNLFGVDIKADHIKTCCNQRADERKTDIAKTYHCDSRGPVPVS